MHPLVQAFEKKQIEKLKQNVSARNFKVGDTLKVTVQIEEKGKKWVQTFEGICLSRTSKSIASSFVVRKIDQNGSIQMRFPIWGENINVEVLKRGKVRRSKLYYLEHCSRKGGRIKELRPKKQGE